MGDAVINILSLMVLMVAIYVICEIWSDGLGEMRYMTLDEHDACADASKSDFATDAEVKYLDYMMGRYMMHEQVSWPELRRMRRALKSIRRREKIWESA